MMRSPHASRLLCVALLGCAEVPPVDEPVAPTDSDDVVDTPDTPDDTAPTDDDTAAARPAPFQAPANDIAPVDCGAPGGFCEAGVATGLGDVAGHGRGLLLADLDGDGWDDVFDCGGDAWPGGHDRAKWYVNKRDGTFYGADVGLPPEAVHDCWGAAAADYDRDGDTDLMVVTGGYAQPGQVHLFRNDLDVDGRMTEVTGPAGITRASRQWWSASWADFDGNGCADLALVPRDSRVELYLSGCDGTFEEVAVDFGVVLPGATELRNVVWFDMDLDGDPDLYVGSNADHHGLFRNDGIDGFVNVTPGAILPAGILQAGSPADQGVQSFATASDDFDQDGWPDLYLGRQNAQDLVLINQHDGTFLAKGREAGLDMLVDDGDPGGPAVYNENTMGLGVGDLDTDGYPDVLIGTGHMTFTAGFVDAAFCNRAGADVSFERCSTPFVEGHGEQRTHGIALGDLNHDGTLDVVYNLGGNPYHDECTGTVSGARNHVYLRQPGGSPATARVRLRGTLSNPDALGARITVHGDRVRHVFLGSAQGYQSTNSPNPTLVLGQAVASARLEIDWPSGVHQEVEILAGESLEIVEPGGDLVPVRKAPQPPAAVETGLWATEDGTATCLPASICVHDEDH